jgi:hypothetical protein
MSTKIDKALAAVTPTVKALAAAVKPALTRQLLGTVVVAISVIAATVAFGAYITPQQRSPTASTTTNEDDEKAYIAAQMAGTDDDDDTAYMAAQTAYEAAHRTSSSLAAIAARKEKTEQGGLTDRLKDGAKELGHWGIDRSHWGGDTDAAKGVVDAIFSGNAVKAFVEASTESHISEKQGKIPYDIVRVAEKPVVPASAGDLQAGPRPKEASPAAPSAPAEHAAAPAVAPAPIQHQHEGPQGDRGGGGHGGWAGGDKPSHGNVAELRHFNDEYYDRTWNVC